MAATVDYLFGYDATARVVEDWMYERVTEAYVARPGGPQVLRASNPWALRGIAERLLEAVERGLWAEPTALALSHPAGGRARGRGLGGTTVTNGIAPRGHGKGQRP